VGKLFADQPVKISRIPSFRAENFPYSGPYPWLDRDDAPEQIDQKLQRGEISLAEAEQCRFWSANGYVILKNLIAHPTLDAVWTAYEQAIASGKVKLPSEPAAADDPYPGRFLNPHRKLADFCRVLKHASLFHWIRLLMEREPRPLQTITSHKGSQQGAHSDSIHMTTYPLGYLTAAWVAFEDIHPDSGPLVYYPGSHKLPYLFSKDVDITESEFKKIGYASYHAKYEPRIRQMIEDHELQPHYFHANKGDVLIWHANLIHGGSPRRNLQLSRKALVCHYFVKGSFAYHDLASSRSRQQYVGTCLLRDEHGEQSGVAGVLKKWL
jgi:Phytanoyl-CoA dioxygenase (PhyH)